MEKGRGNDAATRLLGLLSVSFAAPGEGASEFLRQIDNLWRLCPKCGATVPPGTATCRCGTKFVKRDDAGEDQKPKKKEKKGKRKEAPVVYIEDDWKRELRLEDKDREFINKLISWARDENSVFLDLDVGVYLEEEGEKHAVGVLRKVKEKVESVPTYVIDVKEEDIKVFRESAKEKDMIERRSEKLSSLEEGMHRGMKAARERLDREMEEIDEKINALEKLRIGRKKGKKRKGKKAELEKEIRALQERRAGIARRAENLEELGRSYVAVQDAQREELKLLEEKLNTRLKAFKQEIIRRREEKNKLETLERELGEKEKELTHETEAFRRKEDELKKKKDELGEEMSGLKGMREDLQKKDSTLREKEEEIEAKLKEIMELQKKGEDIEAELKEVELKRSELERLDEEMKSKDGELKEKEIDLNIRLSKIEEDSANLKKKEEELKAKGEAMALKEEELRKREEELKSTVVSVPDLDADVEKLNEIVKMQSEILSAVLERDAQLVIQVIKELDIGKDEIRRLVVG